MQLHLGISNLGEMQAPSIEFPSCPIRVGEGIIAIATFEARETRCFPIAYPPKERAKGFVQAVEHILKDMRGNLLIFRPFLFDLDKIAFLSKERHRPHFETSH